LVKLASKIGTTRLDRHEQEHTASGAHRRVVTPYPTWVQAAVIAEAKKLAVKDALASLAPFVP